MQWVQPARRRQKFLFAHQKWITVQQLATEAARYHLRFLFRWKFHAVIIGISD